jgi:MFS family permease
MSPKGVTPRSPTDIYTGSISVFGPQIFELLGFDVVTAEFVTLGNYLFYFGMMTLAWILIDRVGRRKLMVSGALWLTVSFLILTVLGGLASHRKDLNIPLLATGIPGIVALYLATAVFGIGWLVPPWLIPTEIYPSTARAQGAAISVIIWGLANFAVTLLTPIGFNNLEFWLFLVFAATNAIAGLWTYLYCPESGNRTFEENQEFFKEAGDMGTWVVSKIRDGEFKTLPDDQGEDDDEGQSQGANNKKQQKQKQKQSQMDEHGETTPLLDRTN